MFVLSRVIPLPALVLTFLVLVASSAVAQEPVEVEHEDGAHCNINFNPCTMEAHGESHLSVFGFIISACESHFTTALDEDGTGHVTESHLFDHPNGGDCPRQPCNGVGEAESEVEWDVTNTRETAADTVVLDRNFCLDASSNPNGSGTHCNAPITITEIAAHSYELVTDFTCPNGVRVESHWAGEGNPIEIEHDV
ncbi:MAG TPA: hypothetical protein VHF90_03795 [Thermoleophilaceae bacterium]|nr:hypothetical protein [Thermoleophilaceae bacterium]